MAQMMIEVSERTVRRAQTVADSLGQSVESVLSMWLEQDALVDNLQAGSYEVWSPQVTPEAIRALQQALRDFEAN